MPEQLPTFGSAAACFPTRNAKETMNGINNSVTQLDVVFHENKVSVGNKTEYLTCKPCKG